MATLTIASCVKETVLAPPAKLICFKLTCYPNAAKYIPPASPAHEYWSSQ